MDKLEDSLKIAKENSDISESIRLAGKIVEKTEIIFGQNHINTAISLSNLASLYEDKGEYETAELYYFKGLNILKALNAKDYTVYATILNNLSNLYESIGQYEKAISFIVQASEIRKRDLGEKHIDYASSLITLAGLYESIGQYEKSAEVISQALDIVKENSGEDNLTFARGLDILANLLYLIGEEKSAEKYYAQAFSIRKKHHGENHPEFASSLNNLGLFYTKVGNYKTAELLFLKAKEIWTNFFNENHPYVIGSDYNLTYAYFFLNDIKKAKELLSEINHKQKQRITSLFEVLSETEKINFLSNKIGLSNINNSLLYNEKKDINLFSKVSYDFELFIKSLSLISTKKSLDVIRNSDDTVVKRLFTNWLHNKSELARQYLLPTLNRRADLQKIEEQTEDYEKELSRKSTFFKFQQKSIKIELNYVQFGLKEGEAAVEFVKFDFFNKDWTDSTLYAAYLLTKKDSIPVFVPLFEEKQLQKLFDSAGTSSDAMVSKFYRGLEFGNTGTAASLGKDLYNLVWAPLEPYLKGIKRISYSPAGKLYSIAFHALPVDSNKILMDKYELNQYTSTRQVALRKTQEENRKPQSISLFGDARFTMDSTTIAQSKTNNTVSNIYTPPNRGNRGNNWTDLPGTAEEVKKIKQLFEQNKISTKSFTQAAASEENLKALSGNSPQILHIATHGFFLPEPDKKRKDNFSSNDNSYTLADDPLLRSGLILSGGNYAWNGKTPIEGVEDGIATAYEISQLNLSNTELVVLSACETALGDVKGSEGVFGLQRAFKMAGVKKMIVSLWQVPDKETAELMTAFYGYWLKGKTIEQAFTQAQAEMRKKYSPYYWAAFVLVE